MGVKDGTTAPALFRCGRRDREPHPGRNGKVAHLAAFSEPPDPGPRGRDRGPTSDARRSRHRIDSSGTRVSRPRPLSAFAGRDGNRGGAPDRSSGKAMLRHGLSYWPRSDMDARSPKDLARRAAERRCDDIESILPAACGRPFERNNRCGGSSTGKRRARVGVPSSREGAVDGDPAERSPSCCATSHQSEGSSGRDIRDCLGHGSCTACGHRRLPETLENQDHAGSRGGPPRHGNILDSVDARLRAVARLCTELSPPVCDEPSTPGTCADGRSGPRLQQGQSFSGSQAITLETGRAGRSCLEEGRLNGTATVTETGADAYAGRLAKRFLGVDKYPYRQPARSTRSRPVAGPAPDEQDFQSRVPSQT